MVALQPPATPEQKAPRRARVPLWERSQHARIWSRALAGANVLLLFLALGLGEGSVKDGVVTVTTGSIVTIGILLTLALAWLLPRVLSLPRRAGFHLRAFLLGGQAMHAAGHLARLYYVFPWYDTAVHFALTAWIAVIAVVLLRSKGILPDRHATPVRVALVALLAGLASASAWELFEWSTDQLAGTREQDSLDDTMVDTLAATIGSVVAAVACAIAQRTPRFVNRYRLRSNG